MLHAPNFCRLSVKSTSATPLSSFCRIDVPQVPGYVSAQCLGATCAAFTLRILLGEAALLGVTLPAGSPLQAFVLEVLITSMLLFVTSAVATDTRAVSWQKPGKNLAKIWQNFDKNLAKIWQILCSIGGVGLIWHHHLTSHLMCCCAHTDAHPRSRHIHVYTILPPSLWVVQVGTLASVAAGGTVMVLALFAG